MTITQKNQITALRGKGETYTAIAAALNISENTVKSHCRRNKSSAGVCNQCGLLLIQIPHKRQKKFCSASCRAKWWLANIGEHSTATYMYTCKTCGEDFTAYGNAHRKYCSRSCYGASRRIIR